MPHLLARDIRSSDQHFEWLGTGFYLWQDSPWRARQWAETRFGSDAAVVVVRVDLDGCLGLLNPRWQAELRDADFEFVLHCIAKTSRSRSTPTAATTPATVATIKLVLRTGRGGWSRDPVGPRHLRGR